jgi:hypothetical protein
MRRSTSASCSPMRHPRSDSGGFGFVPVLPNHALERAVRRFQWRPTDAGPAQRAAAQRER